MSRAQPKPAEPGHNSEPAGGDHLRAFIDRVLRLKEEQDTIGEDIRDVYAEAKATGFDKAVMGQVVSHLRKRKKDGARLAEQSALFDTYLAAYEAPSHTHARARAPQPPKIVAIHTNINVPDLPPHDPETGELADLDVAAMFDDTSSSEPPSSQAETKQPEAGPPPPASGALSEMPLAEPSAAHAEASKSDGDRNPVDAALVTAGETAQEIPEIVEAANPPAAAATMAGEAPHTPAASPAAPFDDDDVPAFLKTPKRGAEVQRIRPFCQHPDDTIKCGGYGSVHCPRCERLAQEARK